MTTVLDLIGVTTATVLVTVILYMSTPIMRLLYAAGGISFRGMLRLVSTRFSIWRPTAGNQVSWTGWSICVDLRLRGVLVNNSLTITRSGLEDLCSGRLVELFDKGDYHTYVAENNRRVILRVDQREGGGWWNPCTDR